MKINGRLVTVNKQSLSPSVTRDVVYGVMDGSQRKKFDIEKECNFAISASGIGRFRVSAFAQRNLVGMVLRRIETNIPELNNLGLPEVVKDLVMTKRGLVLLVGGTGTGKSTSLAAMIGHRNQHCAGHIITMKMQLYRAL